MGLSRLIRSLLLGRSEARVREGRWLGHANVPTLWDIVSGAVHYDPRQRREY